MARCQRLDFPKNAELVEKKGIISLRVPTRTESLLYKQLFQKRGDDHQRIKIKPTMIMERQLSPKGEEGHQRTKAFLEINQIEESFPQDLQFYTKLVRELEKKFTGKPDPTNDEAIIPTNG
ncbi:phosphoribosylformylglycinamidine synthase [Corchorus olitorius]|uniref:Phosphoribosylformylglycinamidine synthase n=1 Tax=Corchorus olitorius TaxID=93759 RepID=A0A1R3J6C4_9ROSI|nr:phosphoribosylformylglycinamidine synthase [Corchorus olitorius]